VKTQSDFVVGSWGSVLGILSQRPLLYPVRGVGRQQKGAEYSLAFDGEYPYTVITISLPDSQRRTLVNPTLNPPPTARS
jgi:hypothetical protein